MPYLTKRGDELVNWDLAGVYGEDLVNDLKSYLGNRTGDLGKCSLFFFHKTKFAKGVKWEKYESFNSLSVEEMANILELPYEEEKKTTMRDVAVDVQEAILKIIHKPVPLFFCKEDETENINKDDYYELIKFATSIGDIEWRNELIARECAL